MLFTNHDNLCTKCDITITKTENIAFFEIDRKGKLNIGSRYEPEVKIYYHHFMNLEWKFMKRRN